MCRLRGGVTPPLSLYTHDFLGNVTSVTNPRAAAEDWDGETRTARYEYDIDGQVTKMTDIYGNYTINEYDGLGRLIRTADAESTATSSPYYTTFTYDGLGRLLETQTPISGNMYSQIKNYYDGNGNITSQKVKNGTNDYSVTTTQYNWRNQPTKILTDGTDTAYQYDAVGNIIKHYTGELTNLTDNYTGADYKLTQYTYDNRGNVLSETDSLGKTAYHTYDINGNLTKTVDRNGKTINYVYDPLKNLIKKSAQNGGTEEDVYTYSYNPQGLLLSMTGGGVDSTYTYDNLGRLIREELTNGVVKQYNYDEHGNRTSFILTENSTEQMNVTYSYDKLDRLQSMTANGVTTTYTYDRNGRLLTNNSGDFNTVYTYNLGGMVTELTTQNGDTDIQSHSYTYLPNGNISGKQSTVGTQTTNYAYQYDKAGRLTNETINSVPTAYTYDAWSNRASMTGNGTSSTYTYDANNRLTKSVTEQDSTKTTADYYYDHNGNNISKMVMTNAPKNENAIGRIFLSANTDENVALYEYNSYNQLVKVDTDGKVTTYTYDGNNLRQSKTTNGITTQHIWDGSNMVMDGANKFYRGATGIEFATLNGNTSFYHKDAHGDVTALTDNTGTITQSYIYDAFGNQMNENENDVNPFRYCGEYLDDETGLIYLRNRYYDNSIGRFITQDAHWNVDNMIYGDREYKEGETKTPDINAIMQSGNLYAYCMNNPVKFVDPSGEGVVTCIILGVVIGAVIGGAAGGVISLSEYGEVKWQWVTGGMVLGGVTGALIGWGAGAAVAKFGAGRAALSIINGGGAAFTSFDKLKNFLGSPGAGNHWHHIVEQCQTYTSRAGFPVEWVQNTNNVVSISQDIHRRISAYYSSVDRAISETQTVRDWLSTQSFQQQYEFGIKVLETFGVYVGK